MTRLKRNIITFGENFKLEIIFSLTHFRTIQMSYSLDFLENKKNYFKILPTEVDLFK